MIEATTRALEIPLSTNISIKARFCGVLFCLKNLVGKWLQKDTIKNIKNKP